MKRLIAVVLLLTTFSSLFADPIKFEYEPYEKDEFPEWTMELRRAEIIFFGSFVITLPVSIAAYNIGKNLGMPTPDNDALGALYQFAGAAGLSLLIAGVDWIIGEVQEND